MPADKNTRTASVEVKLSEAMPHIPCPEVHPFPRRAPKPARKPPMANCPQGTFVIVTSEPGRLSQIKAPKISPAA